jgi:hypothetical protein
MSGLLYTTLKAALEDTYNTLSQAQPSTSISSSQQIIPTAEIQTRLQSLLSTSGLFTDNDGQPPQSTELLKSMLDLLAKDFIVTPITSGEVNSALLHRSNSAYMEFIS